MSKHIRDGEPGDFFLVTANEWGDTTWTIWKILDGEDLDVAQGLGYGERVAACVLTGDHLNPPHSPKTDENDPPYAMQSPDSDWLAKGPWTFLGRL